MECRILIFSLIVLLCSYINDNIGGSELSAVHDLTYFFRTLKAIIIPSLKKILFKTTFMYITQLFLSQIITLGRISANCIIPIQILEGYSSLKLNE